MPTLTEIYEAAQQTLRAAGYEPEEARVTARLLLDEISATFHTHLKFRDKPLDKVLDAAQRTRWNAALEQLEHGRPLAYVLGHCEVFGLKFQCDERALIPRPETEVLVEAALRFMNQTENQNWKVADLGTGSGCIAITLALHNPHVQIYATDASPEALQLARDNASTLDTAARVHFLAGEPNDWSVPLLPFKPFDVLVSNPPYIAAQELETLQPQIRDYEPRIALTPGEDGLKAYRQIAEQCGVLLRSGGVLLCELGIGQFDSAREIFEKEGWRADEPIFDYAGIERVLLARRL